MSSRPSESSSRYLHEIFGLPGLGDAQALLGVPFQRPPRNLWRCKRLQQTKENRATRTSAYKPSWWRLLGQASATTHSELLCSVAILELTDPGIVSQL